MDSGRIATLAFVSLVALAGCGDDVDVQTNPGGTVVATGDACVLRVRYTGTEPSEQATIAIDYTGVVGSFGQPRQATTCHSVSRNVDTALMMNFCDHDCSQGERRSLSLQLSTGQSGDAHSMTGPADLVRCEFRGDAATLANLTFLTTDFLTADGSSNQHGGCELVTECGQWTSTTTTSTTSTTEPKNDNDFVVEIQVGDAIALGALQLHVTFPCSAGGFEPLDAVPLGNIVRCDRGDLPVDLWATNERPAGDPDRCMRRATFGVVSTVGFDGPGTVLRCPFHASDGSIDAGVFGLEVDDATDTDGHTQNVVVSVNVVSDE